MVNTKSLTLAFLFVLLIPQLAHSAYVFTAAPRESRELGNKVYKPIAQFLTNATGTHFEYKHQASWKDYVRDMQAQKYDLVFDGPHFVDWRIHNINHSTLVKIPHLLQWRIITQANQVSITRLEDLAGKRACAPGSPNFGMLNLFSHFKDPNKQPIHVKVKGWNNVYEGVKNGHCVAGVLPKKNHEIYDRNSRFTKAIHTHLPYPNQAITASNRLPEWLRDKVREALLSPEGHKAMLGLRKRYTGGTRLVSAEDEEYDSIHSLLIQAKSFTKSSFKLIPHKTNQLVDN